MQGAGQSSMVRLLRCAELVLIEAQNNFLECFQPPGNPPALLQSSSGTDDLVDEVTGPVNLQKVLLSVIKFEDVFYGQFNAF